MSGINESLESRKNVNAQRIFSRREFIRLAGLGTAAVPFHRPLFAADGNGRSGKKPNILFIAVDDLRPQLGCYGQTQMISPNIDRLAAEGVIFKRSFCSVPVCGASRASLLSGVRPTRDRFLHWYTRVDEDLPGALTLPEYFRQNGYHTISIGKVYHHPDDDENGWNEPPYRLPAEYRYLIEENIRIDKANREAGQGRRGPAWEAVDVDDGKYPDGTYAEKAISDLKRLKELNQPFFLAVGFVRPHLPFNSPQKYWDLYRREYINLADNPFRPRGAPDAALHNWGELRHYADIPQAGPLPDGMALTLIHGYYASVSYVDAQIGRLLNELEHLGLADDTIVVLWGDHGWQLGEHGLWCKHCNFQTSLHAPLIIRAPGIHGGKTTEGLTEFVDIYPSLCELCGLELPAGLEGTSFVPLLKDPGRPWKKAIFSRYHDGDSIRTRRYLYTEWKNDEGEVYARMLYDHDLDPKENINISERPENRELVERLSGMLRKGWRPLRREL